jgi:threonine dehydrogenase-like Zn-dependent dehydrogenase
MRGVVFTGNRTLAIKNFPDPHAGPGEAVVRIRASGMCGSDLHQYHAPDVRQAISGHEPCGVVTELGPGAPPGLKIGDRVMVHHYAGCGVCENCAMGYEQLCQQGNRVTYGGGTGNGANAEFILVPSRTLVHLPAELSFEEGAAIACGTGTAWNGLKKMNISGRDTVAVYGQGPVGLSGAISAKAMGARVIAIDVVPERLRIAKEIGADHVINAKEVDPVQAIRDISSGGVTAGLETSGNQRARSQVLESLRPFGRACYVGLGSPSTATLEFGRDIIMKVATIYGSWTFSKAELIEIARHMVEAKVPLKKIFTHRFPLDQADEAFKLFDQGATGKCVIIP